MTQFLWCLFSATLSVALLAFGWMPCPACCGVPCDDCGGGGTIPRTLTGIMEVVSGTCACLNGVTFGLSYDSANARWQGDTLNVCNSSFAWRLVCPPGGSIAASTLHISGTCDMQDFVSRNLVSCSPFLYQETYTLRTIPLGGCQCGTGVQVRTTFSA